jgi:hypothetical protein
MFTALHNNLRFALLASLVGVLVLGIGIFATPLYAQTVSSSSIPLCEIQRGLAVGARGDDVQCLQRYLNWAGFTVATAGAGSPGNETTYYGQLTSNAVARWQKTNETQVLTPLGLTSGTGFFGTASFNYYVELVKLALKV